MAIWVPSGRALCVIGIGLLVFSARATLGAQEEPLKRLTPAEARELIKKALKPSPEVDANPETPFTLQEWKDETVWDRLHAQVFKIIQDNWPRATVLICGKQVVPLGISFGGLGVESLCVTDLDGDKQPELLFTYAWGSGVHRAELGIVRFASQPLKWEPLGLCFLHRDLAVERVTDQSAKVLRAEIRWGANLDKAADGAMIERGAALATIEYDQAKKQIIVKAVDGLDAITKKNLRIGVLKAESAK